jgi:SAM-dependent methyltransferase
MNPAIAARLADLNRRFYAEHAREFARRRATPQPGIPRVLARVPPGARVLELGCGDGKAARALAGSQVAAYLGLDLNPEMLARARTDLAANPLPPFGIDNFSFVQADLTSSDWPRVLPPEPWDWALAFSVFHHLPGFEARAEVLLTLTAHLTPGGRVVMSNWQFTRSERLLRRIAPWSELEIAPAQLEPGDYLLRWERGGQRGLRYVHLLEEAEARRLAAAAGLAIEAVFASDGAAGRLAEYVVMRKAE